MRTRKNDWFNSQTRIPSYGFQVFSCGRWLNAAENGKPCIYATEAERNNKQAEFRKLKAPYNAEITGG